MDEMMNDYLAHHGILGQRWGVRRFQNKDGTLTSEGKMLSKIRKHNGDLSYRIGEKRLSNRLAKIEKSMRKDMASVMRSRQMRLGSSQNLIAERAEIEKAMKTPIRLRSLGKSTIVGRSVATIGGLAVAGASFASGVGEVAVLGLTASSIATGAYWYKSMS